MDFDSYDNDKFRSWLSDKPTSWSAVIATRMALRVLPLILDSNTWNSKSETSDHPLIGDWTPTVENAVLTAFGSCAAARFSVIAPKQNYGVSSFVAELMRRVRQAALDAEHVTAVTARTAADAIQTAAITNSHDAAEKAAHTIRTGRAASGFYPDQWMLAATDAVTGDARALNNRSFAPENLALAGLWSAHGGDTPEWVSDTFRNFAEKLVRHGEHWQVWIYWYRNILNGGSGSLVQQEEFEIAFTDINGPLPWSNLAAAVNMRIVERLLPSQSPAPILVGARQGKIVKVTNRDSSLLSSEPDFEAWRAPVLKHIKEFTSGDFREGTNHPRIRSRLLALEKFLSGHIGDVKDNQFHIGYEIERLDGVLRTYISASDDVPILNAAILEDLSKLMSELKLGTDKFERWKNFRGTVEQGSSIAGRLDPGKIIEVGEKIAETLENNSKYFDPKLPETLRFLIEALKDPAGATISILFGVIKSIENIIVFLSRVALGVGNKSAEAVEKHISKVVAGSMLALLVGGAVRIGAGLPQDWFWLKPILEAISRQLGVL